MLSVRGRVSILLNSKTPYMKVAQSKASARYLKSLGGETMFFRGEHPDKRTNAEWVRYMVKKYPELDWISTKAKSKLK